MGVGDFYPLVRESGSSPDELAQFAGKTVGVDISGPLHRAVSSTDGRDQYHAQPPVPVNAVLLYLSKLVDAAVALGITLICVFDGCRHPAKQRIDEERKSDCEEAQTKLATILARGEAADYSNAQKQRGKCTTVRADIIAMAVQFLTEKKVECVCAPFEADFQLVYMEQRGLIQAIMTEDGDIPVLGGKVVIMNLDLNNVNDNGQKQPMCSVVRRATFLSSPLFLGWSPDDLVTFAFFLGCDYLRRVVGNGLEECKSLMAEWRAATQAGKDAILERMNGRNWPTRKGVSGGKVVGYAGLFEKAKAVFKYAPAVSAPSSARGGGRSSSYKLVPLQSLPQNKDWADLLGWDPAAVFASSCPGVSYQDTYTLKRSPRFPEKDLADFTLEKPDHPYGGGEKAGFGAVLDVEKYPLNLAANKVLITWLWWRSVGMVKSTDRAALIARVKQVMEMERNGEQLTMRGDVETHGSHHYAVWEPQFHGIGGEPPEWQGDALAVFEELRDLQEVGSQYMHSTFPSRPGVHDRAFLRFISGHYGIRSWRVCKACTPEEPDEELTVFEFKVTPSMKSEVYSVVLVFSSDGAFILKLSHCGCPDGCFACSHILGAFLIIMTVQVRPEWGIDDMVAFMPEPIKSIQSIPLAIEFVYGTVELDELRLTKKMKQLKAEEPALATDGGGDDDDDDDEAEEAAAAAVAATHLPDICGKALAEIERAEARAGGGGAVAEPKYKQSKIDEYNDRLVHECEHESAERKRKRDGRLQRVMLLMERDPDVCSENALYPNLSHPEFRAERDQRLSDATWAQNTTSGHQAFDEDAKF